MERDLRCDSKKHAVLNTDEGFVEIKCDSRFCGHERGMVVLHRFDLTTGEFTTKKYKNPIKKG